MHVIRRHLGTVVAKGEVAPALKKLWKKHYEVNGQITQTLSPFEQNIVSSLFKDAHKKIFKQVVKFLSRAGPGLGLGVGIYYWAEWKHKEIAYHHRY